MDLAERFDTVCETPSDINEHLPYLAQLAADAEKVIELGTRTGCSTVAFLFGLEKSSGHLWSVDIDRPAFDLDRWTFVHGNDLDPHVVEQLPDDADVVFIDTSHLYEQTLAELNVYRWKVRPGGKIVLHDTQLPRPIGAPRFPVFPVKKAIEEFCAEELLTWSNRPNCFGLGTIEIPDA